MSVLTRTRSSRISQIIGSVFLVAVLGLSGCGGGGSGNDINLGPLPDPDENNQDGDGNASDDFDFSTAVLTLDGPMAVSPGSTTDFLATLLDADDNAPPNSGLFITIQPTQGTVSPPGGANTDALGEVAFTYSAPNTQTPRTERLTARVSSGRTTLTETLDVRVTPDIFQFTSPAFGATIPPTPRSAFPLELQWVIAGEPADTGRTPPAGGASQVTLSFNSTDGAQGGFTVAGNGPVDPAMVDVANGAFADSVGVLNLGQPGNAVVTAQAEGGYSAQLNLRFLGFADNVDLTANPVTISSGGASNLAATVRDSAGNARSGITVRLVIETCAAGMGPPCGGGETLVADGPSGPVSDDDIILTTGSNGQISAIYRSGGNSGGAILRATVVEGAGPGSNVTDTVAINVNASP